MRRQLVLVVVGLVLLAGAVAVGVGLLTEDSAKETNAERLERKGGRPSDEADTPLLRGSASPGPGGPVPDPAIRGRVVDAQTGAPVANVPVLVLRVEDAFDQGLGSPVLLERRSGEDGTFVVERVPRDHSEVTLLDVGNGWVAEDATDAPPQNPRDPAWCAQLREGETVAAELRVVRAARVEGRVLLPDGSPAVGATVGAPQAPTHPQEAHRRRNVHARFARAVADSNRRFSMDGLSPRSDVYLDARLTGHSRVLSDALDLGAGETTIVTFRFTSPRRALVEVVSSDDGTPIVGALVAIGQYGAPPLGVARMRTRAQTDESGRAVLSPLPPEKFGIGVSANGFLSFRSRGRGAREHLLVEEPIGTFRIRIDLEPLTWVSGRVELSSDMKLEPGQLWVWISSLDAPGYESYGHEIANGVAHRPDAPGVGPNGTGRLPVPRTGLYVVGATLRGFETGPEARVTEEVRPGQEGIVLRLDVPRRTWPGVPVDWWVLDLRMPDGSQAVGATLEIEDESPDDERDLYENLAGREEARAIDGTWRVPVRPESPGLWIVIQGEGLNGVSSGRRSFGPFPPGGGRRTIRLPAAGVIRGRALLPDGAPLIGVEIQGWAALSNESYRALRTFATTDGDGSFLLSELGEDEYELRIKGDGPWLPPRQNPVPPGTEDVLLQALPAVSATVTVLLPNSEPAQRANVVARPKGIGRSQLVRNWGYTDAEGRVVFQRLEKGATYDLSASHGTYQGEIQGWTPGETTVRLGENAHWQKVSGRIVDQHGAPVRGAWVGLVEAKGRWQIVQVHSAGTFSFWLARSATGRVVTAWTRAGLEAPDARPVREVTSGDADVELVLPMLRQLGVQVTGPSSKHVDRLTHSLVPLDPAGKENDRFTSLVEDGKAHFRGLEPDRRYLLWGRLDYLGSYVHAEVEAAATSTTVTLRRGGTIRGRLLTPAGTLEHVEVILRGPGFWLWGEPTVDGTFEIRAVPDGEWTIEAKRYVDGAWRSASTQARPGDVVEIDLRSP